MSVFFQNAARRIATASCLALALSLAACGGGDDGGTPAAASAAAPQPRQTPSTSQTSTGSQAGAPTAAANRAPTITGAPPESAAPGKIYEFRPTADDPDGHELTYSIAGKPKWATFSKETGELRGVPGNGDVGKYENIEISATDGQHTVSLTAFRIHVKDGGPASITLSWLPPTESASGRPLKDLAGYKIYWGKKSGHYNHHVTIESPGVASYVLEHLAPGTYYIVLTAFNSRGEESGFSNMISNAL